MRTIRDVLHITFDIRGGETTLYGRVFGKMEGGLEGSPDSFLDMRWRLAQEALFFETEMFVARLPQRVAEDLQQEAQKQGISLNQYLVYILARYGVPRETDKPEK